MSSTAEIAYAGDAPAPRADGAAGPRPSVHPALFWLLIAFFILEYARPPGLPLLRLQAIFLAMMPVLWLFSAERPWDRMLTLQAIYFLTGAAMLPIAYNYFSVYIASRMMYGNVVIALTIVWVLADWRNFQRALWIWLGIMCYQALFALTHNGRGSGGFLGDENDLALGCVTAFPLAALGFRDMRGWKRWVAGGAALLLLAAVVASFSRGGFIGLIGAVGFMLLAGRRRVRTVLLGLFGAAAFFLAIPADYREEIISIRETTSGTAEVRLFLWTGAVNMWLDHPFLGVGPANSGWHLGDYQPEPTDSGLFEDPGYQERNWTGTALHSIFFEILANRGLVGLSLATAIVWLAFRTAARVRKRFEGTPVATHALALGGALAGVLSCGAFLSIANYPYVWYLSALTVALERASQRLERARAAPAPGG